MSSDMSGVVAWSLPLMPNALVSFVLKGMLCYFARMVTDEVDKMDPIFGLRLCE